MTGLYRRSKGIITQEIVNFATRYSSVQKKLLYELELPYALLDCSSKVLWCNENFGELTKISKHYNKSITTIFPMLTREYLEKAEDIDSVDTEHEGHYYKLVTRKLHFSDVTRDNQIIDIAQEEFLAALYLFDETELYKYRAEIEEQKQVAALVYIDNYEEALDSIEDVKRSLLVALIDRKVNQYFAKMDGLVRKIEKDKYFVVFKHKYLEDMKENKFRLLEEVKGIKVGDGCNLKYWNWSKQRLLYREL